MFKVEEPGVFRGTIHFLDGQLQDGAIRNQHVLAGAGIDASKLDHLFEAAYAQESATACADEIRVVHVARAIGAVVDFTAGNIVSGIGAATVDVDLLKNGGSILDAAIELAAAAPAAYGIVDGVIDTAAYAADDVFEISIDGTAGGGTLAKGVFAFASFDEAYV